MHHVSCFRIAAVTILAMALGCSDDPTLSGPSDPHKTVTIKPTVSLSAFGPRNMDRDYFEIAQTISGFGGIYRDESGVETVYLRDLSAATTAEPTIRAMLAAQGRTLTSDLTFKKADYSWSELYEWKRMLRGLLNVPGVTAVGIDETLNRVTVRIADPTATLTVSNKLDSWGIPKAAVLFRPGGYFEPLASLESTVRPVAGGLKMTSVTAPGGCTLGFVGIHNTAWFVTNSHCTSQSGDADGQVNNIEWHQATSDFIGTEQIDPPFFTGGECPLGYSCRWSDSSIASFGTGDYVQGRIKRTCCANSGAKTIVGDFRIVEERRYPDDGMIVNKVGFASGWTQGDVEETCEDVPIVIGGSRLFLCQDYVDMNSGDGDSGSGVFRILSGYDVQLLGLLWGYSVPLGLTVISPMVNVEYETLEFNTCDPSIPYYFCVF